MKPRIVIVGSGFAGVEAVKKLSRVCSDKIECVWITSNGALVFLPALPELAAGRLSPPDVSFPVTMFAKRSSTNLIISRVTRIDEHRVYLADGERIEYNYLLLATGAAPAFFNIEGAEEYTIPLYSVDAALQIRENARKSDLITIVGAGFVGVEVAAEIKQAYPEKEVTIVDMAEEPIVTLGNKRASKIVKRELEKMNVKQLYGARVMRVEPDRVITTKGNISSQLTIWAAGLRANTPELEINVERVKGGFLRVDPSLRAAKRVYVAGDASCVTLQGCTALKMVREAMRQGSLAAENILRSITGLPPRSYKPLITDCRPLAGVTLGPGNCILIIGKSIAFRTPLVEVYKNWQRKRFKRMLERGY